MSYTINQYFGIGDYYGLGYCHGPIGGDLPEPKPASQPTRLYYAEKYEAIFNILRLAVENGVIECSNKDFNRILHMWQHYRERVERFSLDPDYEPEYTRQSTRDIWRNYEALRAQKKAKA